MAYRGADGGSLKYGISDATPTQNDALMYDGTGFTASACKYGEMYQYENAVITSILTAQVYHAVMNMTTVPAVSVNGVTFGASNESLGLITSASSTTILVTTTNAHGRTTGEPITLVTTGAGKVDGYDGTYTITSVPTTSAMLLTVTSAAGVSSCMSYRPSYLKIGTGGAGRYAVRFNISGDSVANSKVFKAEIVKNATAQDNIISERIFTVGADIGQMTASGHVTCADGDYLWAQMKNETSADNYLIVHSNININRL